MFVIGIVSGIFSCSLLEVPFLVSLISTTVISKKEAFKKAFIFVLGLVTSYILIGLFFVQVARIFARHPEASVYLFFIIGVIGLLWGFQVILSYAKTQKNAGGHAHTLSHDSCACGHSHIISKIPGIRYVHNVFYIYLVGNLFAWLETPVCPCCGPVLYLLSALTVMQGKILFGITTFALYSFGQGIPVILFSVFFTHIINHPAMIKSKHWFTFLSGNVLLFIGILFLWLA
ncbi:cytochrome c biogenesis CcdA family protein [Thermoproteota archaeon]